MNSLRFALLLALCILASACRTNRYGNSIGRAEQGGVSYGFPNTGLVTITEVYPAAAGGAFVELLALRDVADASGYQVVASTGATVSVPGGALVAGARVTVDAAGLGFTGLAQSGEVLLVDGAGAALAYFVWGAHPVSSALQQRAATVGVTAVTIEVPFPRDPTTSIVRDGERIGCALPTPGDEATDDACAASDHVIIIDEVYGQRTAGDSSWMVLENIGPDVLDVGGLRLCFDQTCAALPLGESLAAGASARYCVGPNGTCAVTLTAAAPLPPLGEFYVAAPGEGADVSGSGLVDYMRTQLAATTLEEAAIGLGFWAAEAAPLPTFVAGESESRNPGTLAPPEWFPAVATPETVNPVIDRATNWVSCAEPAEPSTIAPSVVAVALSRSSSLVRIANLGTSAVNLSTLRIAVNDNELLENGALITGSLAPGGSRVLTGVLGDTGKFAISVRSSGQVVQFLQWGNAASGVSAAVADGVWPAESCVAPRLGPQGTFSLRDVILSRGSGGYSQ